MKKLIRWVYDWITVITGVLVGLPAVLLQLLDAMAGVDIAPLVGADKALKIVSAVALVKGLLSFLAFLASLRKPV